MPSIRRPAILRALIVALILFIGWSPLPEALAFADFKGAGTHSKKAGLFSEADYHEHIAYLASDELEGRGTGQVGNDKAADYIATYFRECGVKPAGDDGTYFQNFALKLKNKIADGTKLAVGLPGKAGRKNAKLGADYTPLPFSGKGDFKGEVVFAGYGMSEDDYDDYKDLDVAGKVVLVFRRAPKFMDADMMSGGFRAKASKANAHEAAAMLIVNPTFDEDGDKLYDFNSDSFGGMNMMMGRRGFGIPMMHIKRELADKLLKAAGLPDAATLEQQIEKTKKPASAILKGVTLKGAVDIEPVDTPARNIVGMIPGTGPQKDEIILCGAHYDHLGIRHKGESGFDPKKDISNGADDNASGSCLIMTLAKVFTQGKAPNRTLVLMCFTGEELGLLGSAHFASEPTIDLDSVVAMLNFDMVGRLKDDKLEVGGMRTGGFEQIVKRLAEPYQLKIKDGGGGRGPSDHTSFYNKKIPVLFFFTGLHKQYHQPTDDVPLINVEGAIRVAKYGADVIDEIDASAEPPMFTKDNKSAPLYTQVTGDEKEEQVAAAPRGPSQRGRGGFGNRPRLGIRPDRDAEGEGIVVGEVVEGGPADKAGIKEGDIIVKMGKKKIESPMDMFDVMGNLKWGDSLTVEAKRNDKSLKVELKFPKPSDTTAEATASAGADVSAQVSNAIASIKKAIEKMDGVVNLDIKGKSEGGGVEYDISFKLKIAGKAASEAKPEAKAEAAPAPRSTDEGEARRPRRSGQPRERAERPEGPSRLRPNAGDEQNAAMPPVRLGIMPTYGESEGEGYEIAGVVEGGPAARAGVKDSDRIYQIGDKRVTNVYEYMDSLRKYKPGDEVPVTVLRGGKKITLSVKSIAAKQKEAA